MRLCLASIRELSLPDGFLCLVELFADDTGASLDPEDAVRDLSSFTAGVAILEVKWLPVDSVRTGVSLLDRWFIWVVIFERETDVCTECCEIGDRRRGCELLLVLERKLVRAFELTMSEFVRSTFGAASNAALDLANEVEGVRPGAWYSLDLFMFGLGVWLDDNGLNFVPFGSAVDVSFLELAALTRSASGSWRPFPTFKWTVVAARRP